MAATNNLVKTIVQKEGPSPLRQSAVSRKFETTHPVSPDKQDEEETKTWSMTFFFFFLKNTLFELTKAELQAETRTPAVGWADLVLWAEISIQP